MMAGPHKYGLGDAAYDLTSGFREQERERREFRTDDQLHEQRGAREGRAAAAEGDNTQKRKLELEELRGKARNEGMVEALKLGLAGRLREAESAWNARGESKMDEGSLKYDKESDMFSWTESEKPFSTKGRMLAAIAGVNYDDATKKGGSVPAEVQIVEYYARYLTKGDRKKAFQLRTMAKSDPQKTFARIYSEMQKQNAEAFPDQQRTEDQLQEAAWGVVEYFQKQQLDKLFGEEKTGLEPPPDAVTVDPKNPKLESDNPESFDTLWQ